jgi:menaquinone-9 beta-reductase
MGRDGMPAEDGIGDLGRIEGGGDAKQQHGMYQYLPYQPSRESELRSAFLLKSAAVSGSITANVAIVGAGPAGTATAAHLGRLGVRDVVLLDTHPFPRDKTCGSGVSPKGIATLRELEIWDEVRKNAYPITGLRLVTPRGYETYLSGGSGSDAIVCLRRTLDQVILRKAQEAGVTFIPHFTANRLLTEGRRVTGVAARDGREVSARVTVIAGGTHCRLVPERRPRTLIQAIMGWWEGVPFREHHVEMVFDPMVAPLYGWLFPEGGGRVNIGIAYEDPDGTKNAREMFQRFLDRQYASRLAGATPIGGWKGHPVAYSYRIEGLTSPGRIVVGESGLMTHPATAEGIYQGMRSGMMAAEAIKDVLVSGADEAAAFSAYERRCRKTFRASFLSGGAFRLLLKTPALDVLAKIGEQPFVRRTAARILAAL